LSWISSILSGFEDVGEEVYEGMRFPGFAGNEGVKALLKSRPFSHAYILAGPEGSGKRTLARLIAAAMVCTGQGTAPCLSCIPCRKTMKGTHPDVIHAENGGKGLYVDQIRALRSDAYIRPNEAGRKIFIIHEAQEMNASAQNAMLRLLEDGPSYAAFFLLTDNVSALLPTVRSRCVELLLSPVSAEEAFFWLSERFPGRDEQEIRRTSVRCEGILGRAVMELEDKAQGEFDPLTQAADFVHRLAGGSELNLMEFAVSLEKYSRDELEAFLDAVGLLLRDGLICSMGGALEFERKRAAAAQEVAKNLTKQKIIGTIECIETLRRQCNYNLGAGHCAGRLAAACWEGIH